MDSLVKPATENYVINNPLNNNLLLARTEAGSASCTQVQGRCRISSLQQCVAVFTGRVGGRTGYFTFDINAREMRHASVERGMIVIEIRRMASIK